MARQAGQNESGGSAPTLTPEIPSAPPFEKVADPVAADYQASGKAPMSAEARERIEQLKQQRSYRVQARERARALTDQLESNGRPQLGQRLAHATIDPDSEVIALAGLVLGTDDQLWLHVEVKAGTAEVWLNERKLGDFSSSTKLGWRIVAAPELVRGDNQLMTVVTPDAETRAFDARVLPRRASDGENLHMQTVHLQGAADGSSNAPILALCRVWGE